MIMTVWFHEEYYDVDKYARHPQDNNQEHLNLYIQSIYISHHETKETEE